MSPLTVGSLFSGIGGVDLGLERAGMRVAWQCEIDKDARRVLALRWLEVPVYEDVALLKGDDVAAVDVLCGGFPCQDLSVAGRRAGLAGERSGLFHQFMRLADELAPRWVLIENVPGLLSSNDGRDMGVVLGTLADLGYGWCYRVLDAQYFGVAQRRRRVFIVGHLGDAAPAAEVLLEPSSCDGDSPPCRETGEGIAGTLGGGSGRRGFCDDLDRSGAFIPERVEPTAFMWQAAGNNDASGALEVGMTPTLPKSQTIAVAYRKAQKAHDANDCERWEEADAFDTLASHGTTTAQAIVASMAVRRLTPVECERLQGFPDDWTGTLSDSARYRTLGNAVCVPVVEWIGRRILEAA